MNNYVKTSVPRPVGNPGNGINPKDVLTLIDIDDLVYSLPVTVPEWCWRMTSW